MDEAWALEKLRHFIELTRLQQPQSGGGIVYMGDFASPVGSKADIVASAHVVEKILDRVLPRWRTEIKIDKKGRWQQHREAAQRSIVELEQQAEIASKLGDDSPALSAAGFHPWAWEGARSLWQSGHFREAVQAAAVKVNAETQNKLGRRDISEATLFQQAMSSDPATSTAPRLRPALDDDGKTARSVRRGIAALAEGAYGALRNPIGHDAGELSEQEALEQIAVFSVLARAIDAAAVEQ